MPEKETTQSSSHAPMDPKKKKIIIGVGAFGVLVLGYLWYKNNSGSSSTSTATPSGAGITSYVAPTNTGGGSSGGGSIVGGATPNPITNTFSPSFNVTGGNGGGPAGGTITPTPVAVVPNKGGKTHINVPVSKGATHYSGGTSKISGATSTARPIKVVTNRISGTKDTAAVNALRGANAARQRALKSGNKQAIANATANVKRAQSVVANRNRNASHLK